MTDIKKMETLNTELIQNVETYAENEDCSTKNAFTHVFLDKINQVNSVEFKFHDIDIKSYRNEDEKMRINGYAINSSDSNNDECDKISSITIVVSEFSPSVAVEHMGMTEAKNLLKMGSNFYTKAKAGYFKDIIDYNTGSEIADALFVDSESPVRVYVVLLTNKIVRRFDLNSYNGSRQEFQYEIWDLERIYEYENNSNPEIIIDFEKYGINALSLLKVPEKSDLYDCYVGVIPGDTLAQIYENEDYRLFEKNIRRFLKGTGKINKGIKNTIKENPNLFVAYNNGISTIANSVEIDSNSSNGITVNIKKIYGWQIVNGAQTTSTLYYVYKNEKSIDILKDIFVQIKLVILHEDISSAEKKQLIHDVALYANSQNPIKESDFSAMDEYPQTMYSLSLTTALSDTSGKSIYPFFYENARGAYDAYKESKCRTPSEKRAFEKTTKKITKTVAAKAQMLWIDDSKIESHNGKTLNVGPHIAAKGVETSYNEFMDLIKAGVITSSPSQSDYIKLIAQYIIYASTIKIIKTEAFGDWQSQQVCYTIALLRQYNSQLVDFEKIWNEQAIDIVLADKIKETAYVVWDYFMSIDGSKNIGQWCKKKDCWVELKKYYENKFET